MESKWDNDKLAKALELLTDTLKNYDTALRFIIERIERIEAERLYVEKEKLGLYPGARKNICPKCNVDFTYMTNYVCYNNECPLFSRVTC